MASRRGRRSLPAWRTTAALKFIGGKELLSRRLYIELVFWLALAGAAFAFSFDFDQQLGMYKFGAAAWPRTIIALIVVAAVTQFWHENRDGSESETSMMEEDLQGSPIRLTPRFTAMLGLPLVYAVLLDYTGFFINAPLLVLTYLLITGERRWSRLVGVTLIIYIPILLVFTKIFYLGLPLGNTSPFYEFSGWLVSALR